MKFSVTGGPAIDLKDEEEEGKVVIEAEEYELLKKVKTYKRSYRELFNGIADLKKRLLHQQGVVDRVRKILVSSFETEGSFISRTVTTTECSTTISRTIIPRYA